MIGFSLSGKFVLITVSLLPFSFATMGFSFFASFLAKASSILGSDISSISVCYYGDFLPSGFNFLDFYCFISGIWLSMLLNLTDLGFL
jgi:hypothetical protein